MNKSIKKLLLLVTTITVMCACFTGCRKPYDKPEFVTIEPHQTAFMIPLIGDTSDQASFESEEMLKNAKISAEEIKFKFYLNGG